MSDHDSWESIAKDRGKLIEDMKMLHEEYITRLRAELADVRGQRETLKTECEALRMTLSRKGKSTFPEMVALRAEVERRGEMLQECLPILKRAQHPQSIGSDEAFVLAMQIESLIDAPANQSQRGTPPRDGGG